MARAILLGMSLMLLLGSSVPIGCRYSGIGAPATAVSGFLACLLIAATVYFSPKLIYVGLEKLQRQDWLCYMAYTAAPMIPLVIAETKTNDANANNIMVVISIIAFAISIVSLFTRTVSRVAVLEQLGFYCGVAVWQLLLFRYWLAALYLAWSCGMAYMAKNWQLAEREGDDVTQREDIPLWIMLMVRGEERMRREERDRSG